MDILLLHCPGSPLPPPLAPLRLELLVVRSFFIPLLLRQRLPSLLPLRTPIAFARPQLLLHTGDCAPARNRRCSAVAPDAHLRFTRR